MLVKNRFPMYLFLESQWIWGVTENLNFCQIPLEIPIIPLVWEATVRLFPSNQTKREWLVRQHSPEWGILSISPTSSHS